MMVSKRPSVTLKLATSLDGRIATVTGQSQWITGQLARARVHQMRAEHDCVLTGIGTMLADNPELTARTTPPPKRQPLRAVLDSQARAPLDGKLLQSAHQGPICLFHRQGAYEPIGGAAKTGVQRIDIQAAPDGCGLDLHEILHALQSRFTVRNVMVEAGAQLAGSFLRAGLVDRLVWFRAPIIIGGDGLSVFSSLGVEALNEALAFDCVDIVKLGDDWMETYLVKNA